MDLFDKELLNDLGFVLNRDPDAVRFITNFAEFCHDVDDIIDEKITDSEKLLKAFMLSAAIYTSNFYRRHADSLYPIVMLITNTYSDSVLWEKSNIDWQTKQADVLRNCGNDMLFIIVGIVGGYDALRSVSARIREHSHNKHHTVDNKSI